LAVEPPPAPPAVDVPPPPPPPPPMPALEFAEGPSAAAPDKAPTIALKAPARDQVIPTDKAGDFEVKLDLKGWDVPGGGNHVHLILDGRPYKRIDAPNLPIKLKDIDPNYELKEGQHVLVAFPSRHTHESVKPIGKSVPLAVVPFWIGKKGEVKWKPTDPTMIFSRPKGANNGPAPDAGILVDFYLANVELGEGKNTIQAVLKGPGVEEGKTVTIKDWKPWRIKNPRTGTYSIQMTLMGKDGKPVPGAWNDVTREFRVDLDAPPDPHPMPAADKPADKPAAPAPPPPKKPKK
jgi:hypothetical protein